MYHTPFMFNHTELACVWWCNIIRSYAVGLPLVQKYKRMCYCCIALQWAAVIMLQIYHYTVYKSDITYVLRMCNFMYVHVCNIQVHRNTGTCMLPLSDFMLCTASELDKVCRTWNPGSFSLWLTAFSSTDRRACRTVQHQSPFQAPQDTDWVEPLLCPSTLRNRPTPASLMHT